jgi:iron complex outermembrane receptor protein
MPRRSLIRYVGNVGTLAGIGYSLLPAVGVAQDAARATSGIETIVVTDRALQSEIDLTAGGVTLVDADELRERNTSSLADLLRYVPGIWAESSQGADAMFFSSRGSNLDATNYDMNGIALLQDGLPVTTADGNNHNRVLDPQAARFATIARGANALKYGATTLGGAIDLSSPTARNTDPFSVYVNSGSHGQLIARGTIGDVFNDSLDGLVTFEGKNWDGYRDHSELTRGGLYANMGWRPSDGTESRFFLTYLTNDEELAGYLSREQFDADPGQANPAALTGDFGIKVDTLRLANRTVTQLDANSRIEYGFYAEAQTLYHPIVDVRIDFDGSGPNPPVQVFSLLIDTDHRDVGGMVRYARQMGAHDVLFGLHYGRGDADGGNYWNDGGNRGFLMTTVDRSASNLTVYALDRWQVKDKLLLELGAQGVDTNRDVVNIDAATGAVRAPRGSFSHVTPRAGLIYSASDGVDLFASVSGLYEPPTNFELEDEATGSNAILDAMSGTVLEIGTRGRREVGAGKQVFWEASLYYAKVDDEILSKDDPSAPGTSLSANIDSTTHSGLEAAFGAELPVGSGSALAPRLSLAINDFAFDGDPVYGNNDLPAAPGYVLRGELMYRHSSGFFVGPTFDVVDDRSADFMNTYKVDSYSLLGLRAGWTQERWNVFADLVNATDKRYVSVISVQDIAAADAEVLNPGSPRSLYVGIQGRF